MSRVLRSSRALLIRWFCLLAAIFASGALGASLPSIGSRISLFLLPSGFAVAAMCRWGFGMWSAVLLGGMGIDLWQHRPLIASAAEELMRAYATDHHPAFSGARREAGAPASDLVHQLV